MKKNERLQALLILSNVIENKTPLSHLMHATHLSPFAKELCFGICRHYFRLEAIALRLLKKKPKALNVWLCLLMGLYQLHYLRTPDYASIKETVALLEYIKKSWAKDLINAVLRTYCRKQDTLLKILENDPAFHYGHPKWLIQRLQKEWPHHWQEIIKANDQHPPLSLRVNAQLTTRFDYLKRLQEIGVPAEAMTYAPFGIDLKTPCNTHNLPSFTDGHVSIQDEAAQLAVSLLALKPGLTLLDACAAPGGKTCHILESEPNLSKLIAVDLDNKRLTRIQENLNRLKLKATLIKGDARDPISWWDGHLFDRILLDAPCSATGVIRRHPDIKLLRTAEEITAISKVQHDLLHTLWDLLKPGGVMVYATCSIMHEENEQQIARFIHHNHNCQFLKQNHPWGHNTGHGWQILPGDNNMDGFFYSCLLKTANPAI